MSMEYHSQYSKKHYKKNKKQYQTKHKEYYEFNKEDILKKNREQYKLNKDKKIYKVKVCPICKKQFEASHGLKKYCCDLCAKTAIREKDKLRNSKRFATLSSKEYHKKYSKEYDEKYYKVNKEKINKRKTSYMRKRKKADPLYKFKCSTRSMIGNSFKRKGLKKSLKTENILGCTLNQFREHIENKFKSGMNFDNHGSWHIDHDIPLATAKTKEEVAKLCHYTNLQPLWAKENREKHSKVYSKEITE